MMRQRVLRIGSRVLLVMISLSVTNAEAQLFGARTFGQPLRGGRGTPGLRPPAIESAGVVEGDERFLRENRKRNDYVGSDRSSLEGFVGSEQAIGTGRVRTSVETLRERPDRSGQINRPLRPLRRGAMYYPQLSIDASEMSSESFVSLVRQKRDVKLTSLLTQTAGSNIQIYHQGGRTILRGTVASEAMAEKLRILASFEPHIDQIDSELVVAGSW